MNTSGWNPRLGEIKEGPMLRFHDCYQSALEKGLPLPERAALATADADARPSVRYVLVRGYDQNSVVFFTNYESRKGLEIATNPVAALAFHWYELDVQIRMEGAVEKVPVELSRQYFLTRPPGNRAAAIVSPQSRTIEDYDRLHRQMEDLLRGGEQHLMCPPEWGGYRLWMDCVECWTNDPDRLHRRELWKRQDQRWVKSLLAP